MEEVFSLG